MRYVLSAIAALTLAAGLMFSTASAKQDCCPNGKCCPNGACCRR